MTTKLFLVRVEDDNVVRAPFRAYAIVFKRFVSVEVEDENSGPLLVDNQLIFLVT